MGVLHHRLLDRGALGLTADGRVRVSEAYAARKDVGKAVYALADTELRPRPGDTVAGGCACGVARPGRGSTKSKRRSSVWGMTATAQGLSVRPKSGVTRKSRLLASWSRRSPLYLNLAPTW